MSDKPVHYTSIHVQEARELLNDPDTVIIDIRDKVTFEAGNIPNSINVSEETIVDFLGSTDDQAPLLSIVIMVSIVKTRLNILSKMDFNLFLVLMVGILNIFSRNPVK